MGNATFQPNSGGNFSALNISAATVVSANPALLVTIIVTTAGAPGAIYDSNSLSGNTAANLICNIPPGITSLSWPCFNGILIEPGAGQVVSLTYS